MPEDKKHGFHPSDSVHHLVPDAASPGVARLTGFKLGESDRQGYWRLYLSPSFTKYIEFKKDDVVGGEELRDTTVVWVRSNARVTCATTHETAADFLKGPVRSGFQRKTGFAGVLMRAASGSADDCCGSLESLDVCETNAYSTISCCLCYP
jgi:hypothetical protein